jgi:N-methylhydantoinase A
VTYRISIDTGGTFTDVVVADAADQVRYFKVPTNRASPSKGILDGLAEAAAQFELGLTDLLHSTTELVHGSTVATNAIVQGQAGRTGMITTRGFRDVLLYREGGKPDPHNFQLRWPAAYIARDLIVEVNERIGAAGAVVMPLDENDVHAAVDFLREREVEAIAVCLLWSIENPVHENRTAEIIHSVWPNVYFSLSHQVNPIIREYRRFSATAIDASLKPVVDDYLSSLDGALRRNGFSSSASMFTSNGSLVALQQSRQRPVETIGSGPALAPVAARFIASRELITSDLIVVDTGGTTFDVSAIRDGAITVSSESWIGPPYLGHLTGISTVGVKSIGAGGGSIATVDSGGLLRVGPESAGAEPGPACYGRGGDQATVTDAALVLGYLDQSGLLGGRMPLDVQRAKDVVREKVGEPLGTSTVAAAAGILEVQTANMVTAIEDITIGEGFDPREATIIAGGGAAGLNIVDIARQLQIQTVVLPHSAGVFSAFGGLVSDFAREFAGSYFTTDKTIDLSRANQLLEKLSSEGRTFLNDAGVSPSRQRLEVFVEARYPYQVWELRVPIVDSPLDDPEMRKVVSTFHRIHKRVFAVDDPESGVEFVTWIVRARGMRDIEHIQTVQDARESSGRLGNGHRHVFFPGLGDIDTALIPKQALSPGAIVDGPAIIGEEMTTIVLPPRSRLRLTEHLNLVIDVRSPEST